MCNIVYAHLRAELVASLVMCDGSDRQKALDQFDRDLNAPSGGWEAADRRLYQAIRMA